MSIVATMKLLLLVVTYNLAELYTSRAIKLCGLRMKLKQYLTTRFELGERTGNKADPGKVAADMRTSRNPDGSHRFERKD